MKLCTFILDLLCIIVWTACAVLTAMAALTNPLVWIAFYAELAMLCLYCVRAVFVVIGIGKR